MIIRAGIGYDVHAFREGATLVLGGVVIPHHRGLEGHSDADVLLHALMDALLGAACLGDIGSHFPSGDPRFRDISSLLLLQEVSRKLQHAGCRVNNIDSVIVAQAPVLAPYIPGMRKNIAGVLGIAESCVSVKATTTEGLGFTGREEGISSYAVTLLQVQGSPE